MKALVAIAAAAAVLPGHGVHPQHQVELGSNVLAPHTTAPIVRADACWQCVQPTRGRWDWSYDDAIARRLKARWQPILDYAPAWASARPGTYVPPSPEPPTSPFARSGPPGPLLKHKPPLRLSAFARYAAAFTARYHPRAIEIWNEPDITQFWDAKHQPAAYAHLFAAAYRAIKRVDPHTLVLAAGLDEGDGSWFIPAMAPSLHGVKPDGWSVHPYAASVTGMQRLLRMDVRLVRRYHIMAPFYVTEFGCSFGACLPGPVFKRQALLALARDPYVVQADWWGNLYF